MENQPKKTNEMENQQKKTNEMDNQPRIDEQDGESAKNRRARWRISQKE